MKRIIIVGVIAISCTSPVLAKMSDEESQWQRQLYSYKGKFNSEIDYSLVRGEKGKCLSNKQWVLYTLATKTPELEWTVEGCAIKRNTGEWTVYNGGEIEVTVKSHLDLVPIYIFGPKEIKSRITDKEDVEGDGLYNLTWSDYNWIIASESSKRIILGNFPFDKDFKDNFYCGIPLRMIKMNLLRSVRLSKKELKQIIDAENRGCERYLTYTGEEK